MRFVSRQSAAGSDRSDDANLPEEKRRHSRSAEDHVQIRRNSGRPRSYRAKVKTPLEFVVSAVRASGAEVSDALPLARQLQNMGMPLYGMQPPTGYSMKAETWVNSSALLGRMNFSLALIAGKLKGVQVDSSHIPDAGAAIRKRHCCRWKVACWPAMCPGKRTTLS